MGETKIKAIAYIHSDFKEKFGIPRQGGMADRLVSKIVFEPEYRMPEAIRGLEEYTHIWLIWEFSENLGQGWSPTVRPPRLGGNRRWGVFATRSPFRPNPLGLSCVRLDSIDKEGSLLVRGADLMDGTPIFDIKPYIPMADCRPEAKGSFSDDHREDRLNVEIPPELLNKLPGEKTAALAEALSGDPRPAYHTDSDRVYKMSFGDAEISFSVKGGTLTVLDIEILV